MNLFTVKYNLKIEGSSLNGYGKGTASPRFQDRPY